MKCGVHVELTLLKRTKSLLFLFCHSHIFKIFELIISSKFYFLFFFGPLKNINLCGFLKIFV